MPPTSGHAHRLEVHRLADDLDVGQPGEQLPEDDCELAAGEVRAQAEVGAGPAEADVRVGIAPHVEALRVVEHSRVAVGGAVEEDEPVAFVEVLARQGERAGHRAAHERDRRRDADDLLDRGGGERVDVVLPEVPLVGVLRQEVHPDAWWRCAWCRCRPRPSRMKNGAISFGASMSSPTSAWTSAEVRSSVGLRAALLGELVHQAS